MTGDLSSVRGRLRSARRPCSVCRRWITCWRSGTVRPHGRGKRCKGSGKWPGPAWKTVRINQDYL